MMKLECVWSKQSLIGILFLLLSVIGYSQNETSKFQLGIHSGYFVAGDFKTTYDAMLGVDAEYVFYKKPKMNYLLIGSVATDIGGKGASLLAINMGIGARYDLISLWKKPVFIQLNVGGLYLREQFSTQLIKENIASTFSEFGVQGAVYVGYKILRDINFRIGVNQYNNKGTAIEVGVSYLF